MSQNKKVVGIITINDYTNYGNRLQNYALTRLFEISGYKVVNGIRVFTKEDWVNRTSNSMKKMVKKLTPYFLIKDRLFHDPKVIDKYMLIRKERFFEFTKKYTEILPPIICRINKQAYSQLTAGGVDYFITGSDQVWNPYYEANGYEFLTFVPKEKRISFAASIGVDSIPLDMEQYFKNNFANMKFISVREESAAHIIKEIAGKDAIVTLDPTLLLDKEEWELIIHKPRIDIEHKYICTYFLGEVPQAVGTYAEKTKQRVYSLNSKDDIALFTFDPSEFLYMIRNASCILTDSFHAVAFSIKFNKEFYVFNRKEDGVRDMFLRVEGITKHFRLENRIMNREIIIEQPPISNWRDIENELSTEKNNIMKTIIREMDM